MSMNMVPLIEEEEVNEEEDISVFEEAKSHKDHQGKAKIMSSPISEEVIG